MNNISIKILTPSKFANMEQFYKAKAEHFEKKFKLLSNEVSKANIENDYTLEQFLKNEKIFFDWNSIKELSIKDLLSLLITDPQIIDDPKFDTSFLNILKTIDWLILLKNNIQFKKYVDDTIIGQLQFKIHQNENENEKSNQFQFNELLGLIKA
jgi:hypothetical protein